MTPTDSDRIKFERTNVVGTENLAKAAATAGVNRFVYLSSIKVSGEMTGDRRFRADDVPRGDDYGRSKLEAEREDTSTPLLIGRLAAGLQGPARLFAVPLAVLDLLAKATGMPR